MGGGNGAKAAHKREKNAEKAAKKGASSQLKTNEAAKTIKCKVCFTSFQGTMKKPALEEHASNKHSKTYDDCF